MFEYGTSSWKMYVRFRRIYLKIVAGLWWIEFKTGLRKRETYICSLCDKEVTYDHQCDASDRKG